MCPKRKRGTEPARRSGPTSTCLQLTTCQFAGLTSAVVDCKTTRNLATERASGSVASRIFFGARAAYMTRDTALPPSTRQLAPRLAIAAMDVNDRTEFLKLAGDRKLPRAGTSLQVETLGVDGADRRGACLCRPPTALLAGDRLGVARHRNLAQLPFYLDSARTVKALVALAQVIVIDCAWLDLVSVLFAVDEVIRLHLTNGWPTLKQVVVGNGLEIRDREELMKKIRALLEHVAPDPAERRPNQTSCPGCWSSQAWSRWHPRERVGERPLQTAILWRSSWPPTRCAFLRVRPISTQLSLRCSTGRRAQTRTRAEPTVKCPPGEPKELQLDLARDP